MKLRRWLLDVSRLNPTLPAMGAPHQGNIAPSIERHQRQSVARRDSDVATIALCVPSMGTL